MARRGSRQTEGSKLRTIRESELKRRDTVRLRELSARIKRARATRREALKHIRELCRFGRDNVRSRVHQLREETKAKLREQVTALRSAERAACALDQDTARRELSKHIDQARDELAEQRRSFKHHYGRKTSRSTAAERREEADHEVAANLPPELVAVWNHVKGRIRGSARRSRTEAFLEWVEENPDEVHAIMYEDADRDVARLIAEHEATEARLAKARRGRGYRDEADVAAALGVPF